MFKKIVSLIITVAMVCSVAAMFTGCDSASDFRIGVILIGDETEGYSAAHIQGIKAAAANLGIADSQIDWKYKVADHDSSSLEAATDLVGKGCNVIIANSYGHQTYMAQVAADHPDVTFIAMTGDFAAISGLDNYKNAFTSVYESRYVSGVVAGLKLQELLADGTLSRFIADIQQGSYFIPMNHIFGNGHRNHITSS